MNEGEKNYEDKIGRRQSSLCRRVCCFPCRAIFKCFHCLTNVLVVRQAESAFINMFNNKIAPFLAGVLVSSPIGLLLWAYGTEAVSAGQETASLMFKHVTSIPEYAGPVIEQLSSAWNVTYITVSATGNTISSGIQSGYNMLAPYINKTIETGSSVSMHLQQGYQGFLPFINETVSNLRKKDEVHN